MNKHKVTKLPAKQSKAVNKVLHWIVVSFGMIPSEIWQGFFFLMGLLIMNYYYPDMMMLF
jgi:hypothetical protein